MVEQAIPMLIELLKDPSVVVRDTTAWTVGRVCEILPEAVINEHFLNPLLHAMVEGLTAEPRVASNVCWVSYNDETYIERAIWQSLLWVDGTARKATII